MQEYLNICVRQERFGLKEQFWKTNTSRSHEVVMVQALQQQSSAMDVLELPQPNLSNSSCLPAPNSM